MDIYHAEENEPVTDAEIDAVVAFLTNVQFTPIEK